MRSQTVSSPPLCPRLSLRMLSAGANVSQGTPLSLCGGAKRLPRTVQQAAPTAAELEPEPEAECGSPGTAVGADAGDVATDNVHEPAEHLPTALLQAVEDLKIKRQIEAANQPEVSSASAVVFSPVRLTASQAREQGSAKALTPVRRSVRLVRCAVLRAVAGAAADSVCCVQTPGSLEKQTGQALKDALAETNYTFRPNPMLSLLQ